jgi:hypothetical protein
MNFWKLILAFLFLATVYSVIDYSGPRTIDLREDQAFGISCLRARDLIVQEFDASGNLWASRGMIVYKLNKGESKFKRIAHVPTGITVFWLRNFTLLRRITMRPECIEFVQGQNGELCALSAGKMWYRGPEERKFRQTLKLEHYGFGDQGMRNAGILRTNDSTIFFGEYFGNLQKAGVNIYKSEDNGLTWSIAYPFKPGQIRHIHALQKDPYTGKLWVCVGDSDEESMVGWSEDNFSTIVPLGSGSQMWRVCQLVFTEDAVFWGTDTGHDELRGFYRWDKNTHEIARLQHVDGAIFYGTKLANELIVMSSDREGWDCEIDDKTRLWVLYKNRFVRSIDAGTWDHSKEGFRFKFAKLRFHRNQDSEFLAVSVLNQKEFTDGDLILISGNELMHLVNAQLALTEVD